MAFKNLGANWSDWRREEKRDYIVHKWDARVSAKEDMLVCMIAC